MDADKIIDESIDTVVMKFDNTKIRYLSDLSADADIDHDLLADDNQIMSYEDVVNLHIPSTSTKPKKKNRQPSLPKVLFNLDDKKHQVQSSSHQSPTAPPDYTTVNPEQEAVELKFSLEEINIALMKISTNHRFVTKNGKLDIISCEPKKIQVSEINKDTLEPDNKATRSKREDLNISRSEWIFPNKMFGNYRITDVEIKSFLSRDNPVWTSVDIDRIYSEKFTDPESVLNYLKNTKKYRNIDKMVKLM